MRSFVVAICLALICTTSLLANHQKQVRPSRQQVSALRKIDDDFFSTPSKPKLLICGHVIVDKKVITVIQGELVFGGGQRMSRRIFFVDEKVHPIGCIFDAPFPLLRVEGNSLFFDIQGVPSDRPCGKKDRMALGALGQQKFEIGCEFVEFTPYVVN